MKNFIFISPNFPENYWLFCNKLKENGLNVLGIGDCVYDNLKPELKNSLTEYYKVSSLENYDEVYRAVAFFAYKYGRINFLESNNEYWLERDSMLREEFNIPGFKPINLEPCKYKSKMKEYYNRVGINTARYYLVETYQGCLDFINEVGYPVIAKPDNGVGANGTYKIKSEDDLQKFFNEKQDGVLFIMEEFIYGTVNSYDAIINSKGEPLFETGNVTVNSLMDVVNTNGENIFYIRKELPEDIREAGRKTVKSFGVTSRFVHFEFFRLEKDMEGLGKKGEVVALEVNMRPSGGVTPDMMNFAHSTDVYEIWADMICFDKSDKAESNKHQFCCNIGRRDGRNYFYSDEQIKEKYAANLKMAERTAEALSGAMGNRMFLCNFDDEESLNQYMIDCVKLAD